MAEDVDQNHHHHADNGPADDILGLGISRQLAKAILHHHEQPNEGPGSGTAEDSERDESDRGCQPSDWAREI
jgi:hypothetical protein